MINFVNPIFAWLTVAAAIPIIIHLLNRRRFQNVPWAAMEFLIKALEKNRRRLQVENLILLILRTLIIALLALTLAQPYLKGASLFPAQSNSHFIIALDNSMSMGYRSAGALGGDLFGEAKKTCENLMESLRADQGNRISLIAFSANSATLMSDALFESELAKNKLEKLALSGDTTNIIKAILAARDIFSKSTAARKILYIITDNQKNGWDGLGRDELLPTGFEIRVIAVGPREISNNFIAGVRPNAPVILAGKPVTFEADINKVTSAQNAGGNRQDLSVKLSVNGHQYSTANTPVAANKPALAPFSYTFPDPGNYWLEIGLPADNLAADDKRLYSVTVKESIPVLIVNGNPSLDVAEDEITFLKNALLPGAAQQETEDRAPESPYSIDTMTANQFIGAENIRFNKYDAVILANVEYLPLNLVANLESWVKAGGGLMIFLGDKINRDNYNEWLYRNGSGLLPFQLGGIKGDPIHNRAAAPADIDVSHPALAYFANLKERFSALSIYQYYELISGTADSKVLAHLNDAAKSPFIAEKSYYSGKVMAVATGAGTKWNLMPARPTYVMLMDQLTMYLATIRAKASNLNIAVNEPIEYRTDENPSGAGYSLRLPDNSLVSLSPSNKTTGGAEVLFSQTILPGLYSLNYGDRKTYFSVNANPKESDIRRISAEELRRLHPNIRVYEGEGNPWERPETDNGEPFDQSNATHLWKYLLYAMVGLIVLETVLAWQFGRR